MFICPIMICSNNIMTIYYVHLTCFENAKKKKIKKNNGPKFSQMEQCFGKTSKTKWILFDKMKDSKI